MDGTDSRDLTNYVEHCFSSLLKSCPASLCCCLSPQTELLAPQTALSYDVVLTLEPWHVRGHGYKGWIIPPPVDDIFTRLACGRFNGPLRTMAVQVTLQGNRGLRTLNQLTRAPDPSLLVTAPSPYRALQSSPAHMQVTVITVWDLSLKWRGLFWNNGFSSWLLQVSRWLIWKCESNTEAKAKMSASSPGEVEIDILFLV